jgi:hypothetical protein
MAEQETLQYTCDVCGYENLWTRDQIVQRGREEVYRAQNRNEVVYSLRCKNPKRPPCEGRRLVGVAVEE